MPKGFTPDYDKLRGCKLWLDRTQSNEYLLTLADTVATSSTDEISITSTSAEGGSAMGEVTFPKWLLQIAVEELIREKGIFTPSSARSLCSRPDWSRAWATT